MIRSQRHSLPVQRTRVQRGTVRNRLFFAAVVGLCGAARCFAGAVVTDGSVGAKTSLTGPTYNIPASLGQQKGGNLFHSFTTFNLSKNDVASFSGPANVSNVIARVTGGTASNIDGTVQCTIVGANLYLVNPSGVIFGPDSAIDVKGSFVVTTADYLKMADGSHFNATNLADSVLTSATPAAFGFLAAKPAAISTTTANLTNNAGAISFIGGDVQISGGVISAPGQRINIVSAASPGELTLDAASILATIDLTPGGPALGDVSLSHCSLVTSGDGGGRVSIRAGSLEVLSSVIVAQNTGTTAGQGIDIAVTGAAVFSPAIVSTDVNGAGSAGAIDITAGSVTIDGSSIPSVATGITSSTGGPAAAGAITFNTGSFTLAGGSEIFSGTVGAGNGGNVTINATGDAHIDGTNFPATAVAAFTNGTGRAGNITVNSGTLELSAGGTLGASTDGLGNAGNISVTANSVSIDNTAGTLANRGIAAVSLGTGTSGNAGQITVNTGALSVTQGALISTASSGTGNAGSIFITGGTVTLDEGASTGITGLFAPALSSSGSSAGTIAVSGTSVQLLNGAVIFANSASPTSAGSVTVKATDFTLNNNGLTTTPFESTGIFADTTTTAASAPGGQINITANTVSLLGGGRIAADALDGGTGGVISIAAQSLTMDGQGAPILTGLSVESLAGAGNAGKVIITTATGSVLGGASITVGASGSGAGGSVSIAANQSFTIDGQNLPSGTGIFANGTDGPGGNVQITGGALSLLNGAQITAGSFGLGSGGTVGINVSSFNIQGGSTGETQVAALALGTGNSGTIDLTTSGALTLTGNAAIAADTSGPGMAGIVNITSGSLTLNGAVGIASIESATSSSGNAGTVNVNISGDLQVLNGSTINASTSGSGNGGTVNVTATTITLDQQTSSNFTGILSDSLAGAGTTTRGAGGTVNVHANSLIIDNNAEINTTTFGAGSAGGVSVTAGSIFLENGGSIISNSNVDATGSAGNISIQAGLLQIVNSSQITSDTLSSGAGGNVSVKVTGPLVIDGQDFKGTTNTGITAVSSGVGGNAGHVDVSAGSILLRNRGTIDSNDEGSIGGAGSVAVSVVNGLTMQSSAAISSNNHGDSQVPASVTVSANTITLQSASVIGSATFGNGIGGDIAVTARKIILDGKGTNLFTGISAQSQGNGNAGSVDIVATRSVQVINESQINSASIDGGAAGNVSISGADLTLKNNGVIGSNSFMPNANAGAVEITLSGSLNSSHSRIAISALEASSDQTIGMRISAGKSIDLIDSRISAEAADSGGNVSIKSPGIIDIQNSRIFTSAVMNDGGNIIVDPSFVILDHGHISANGGNNGGNITIRPTWFLESQSTITATGTRGVSGTLQVTPDYNLSGALLSLPAALSDNLTLQPECAADLPGAVSSFIVTGRGGSPLQPDGWSADLELRLPTTRPR